MREAYYACHHRFIKIHDSLASSSSILTCRFLLVCKLNNHHFVTARDALTTNTDVFFCRKKTRIESAQINRSNRFEDKRSNSTQLN